MSRWGVVLAGGSGTRFWPLSTPKAPKQFLPLTGSRPLVRDAVDRLHGVLAPERILVVTGHSFRDRAVALFPDLPADHILAEPLAASTGPALTWATWFIAQRDERAVVLSVHADWHIGDDQAFRDAAECALAGAERHDRLVTVGIVPRRPDAGYGYIVPGKTLDDGAREVDQFVEKPEPSRAQSLIEQGALWNCGVFAWTAHRFFKEMETHAPEISPHVHCLADGSARQFFEKVTPIAVDVALFERSATLAVVQGDFPWDDIGTWSALTRVRSRDQDGNVLVGNAMQKESGGCIAWSEEGRMVLFGVRDIVVAQANGITLVTTPEHSARLKALIDELPPEWREP